MKALLTKNNEFRTIEKLENDTTFKCRYTGGEKFPFSEFATKISLSFEEAITRLIKDGYTLVLMTSEDAITREDFESYFCKTAERITFTFNCWDGKSYDGESRSGYVYRTIIEGYENVRFVKVGKGLYYIDEDSDIIEKATGIAHKEAKWLADVKRA